jgi:hypothetical protein
MSISIMETFYEIGMPKFINHLKDKFFNTINFVLKPEETFKNMCLDILQDKQIIFYILIKLCHV